ncbi:MAG TPA: protein kinase [Candidatus Limnocylindrales bacterium]|nr:protein kinase [Candidatus Limnocylindrales bacterium]
MTSETPPDPIVGRTLADRYRIDAPIARGGMARVYRARDVRLDRDVALKVLSQPYAGDPSFTERFLAEARAAASLSHPSLVHVYDSGSDGDAHFIVMELLDRHRSMRQVLEDQGPMSIDEVRRLAGELLAGLRVIHDRGLVHCDVKSGNVMLGPGGAKLIDFGIARTPHEALEGDTSIGSLQFMSPEQLHGEGLSPASDLFSLGVVLYEALTGRMPYEGRTPEEVSAAQAAGVVRPASAFNDDVPERLDAAILQALRREPESRFRSAEAMAMALGDPEEATNPDTDETRVIAIPDAPRDRPPDAGGYVPPPAPAPQPAPRRAPARPPPRQPSRRPDVVRLLGTLIVLAGVALVVFLVILPLLESGGGDGSPQVSTSPTPGESAPPGRVLVPDTVGLPTADAIDLATEAGLDWTVRCAEDPAQPEGITSQEPPPSTPVTPGSRFTMFSARISDCQ